MDVAEVSNELQDWEVLHSSSDSESAQVTADGSNAFDEIDSGVLIQVDYFSLESQNYVEELDDGKSAEADNPSWIDPGLEENSTRYLNKDSGEFWYDSSSERAEEHKFGDFERRNEMGVSENLNTEVRLKGIEEIIENEEEKMEDLGKTYSESSGTEMGSVNFNDFVENYQVGVKGNVNLHDDSGGLEKEKSENGIEATDGSGNNSSGEINKKSVVWWKMPMEFLKYFVFRMSPVWTVSVAAAVMGFVILGRRLYAKKKTRGLQIKVVVDNKKVSQVMSHAARLNELFSVVKQVPMIRHTMPSLGPTTWPAISLR